MQPASATRSVLVAALAGVYVLAAGTPALAGPATDRLRDFFGRVNGVLNDPTIHSEPLEKVARIKHLVTDIADVRGVAAAVLEREWDKRTPAERDEFARMFSELLERGLVARLAGTVSPVKGMVMSWRGESRVGDESRVMTVVESRDGRKVDVEYRMIERRGRWLVRDVVVDGISTIANYRSQFKHVLRQGGYAGLVVQLRKKLGEETLMFAQTPAAAIASPPKPPERMPATRPSAPRATPAASPPGSTPLSRPSSLTAAPKPTAKAPVVVAPGARPPARPAAAGKAPTIAPVAKAPASPADANAPERQASP